MREIKYRALAKDGTWRYGLYPCMNVDMGNTKYPMDIFWNKFLSTFRRETLGQWTGLLGKNGEEIYEGDIVERTGPHYAIFWHDFTARWVMTGHTGINGGDMALMCEVIGNIYENPELVNNIQ